MSKIYTIGDPHFKVSNRSDMKIFVEECIASIKQKNPDIIVVMGDVLDRHETIHVHALMDANSFLIDLSKITKTYVLIGNHDRPNNSNFLTDEHPFTALKHIDNLVIVDNVLVEGKYMWVPYVPPGRFFEAIEGVDLSNITCIFAHQEFRGANMKSIVSSTGDIWPENHPLVISGHIHEYQQIQDNIIYVGTPMQHNFGDTDDCSVSYFEFANDEYVEERIYLNIPKKRVVKLDHENVKEWLSSDNTFNGLTKLVITGPNEKLAVLSKNGVLKDIPDTIKISLVSDITENQNNVDDNGYEIIKEEYKGANFKKILIDLIKLEKNKDQIMRVFGNLIGEAYMTEPVKEPAVKKKIISLPIKIQIKKVQS